MLRTIIIVAVVALLGYFAFNYSNSTVNNEEEQVQNSDQIVDQETGEDTMEDSQHGGDTYSGGDSAVVEYQNHAMGYTIMRPDKWFWQHSIKSQIVDGDEKILDVFATDPFVAPLANAPQNSRISIVVYSDQSDNFDEMVNGLENTQVSIAGQSASRYEGIVGKNEKIILYTFNKEKYIYHLAYHKTGSTPEEEGVFENLVSSLTFK